MRAVETSPTPRQPSDSDEVTGERLARDDEPISLADACKLFPRARLTVSTLRAEADRGRLEIFRLGKRDYTTPRAMKEMVRLCQEGDPRRGSTSTRRGNNGPSETARCSSALAAARMTVEAEKNLAAYIAEKHDPEPANTR
jgi:hypothetical protein